MGKHKTPAEREIAIRVGSRIRQLREIQHVSQIRLATEIGIRAGPLGWIEKGKHLPSGRVLYRIAKQLNVRIDDLFQEKNVWDTGASSSASVAPVLLPPLDNAAADNSESVK
jgi:transcriptional regulator with XRE-family HTH domain